MTITIYELLGMVKDGKAPKKIIAGDSETEYYFDKELKDYINLKTEEKLFEDEIGKFLKYYINDEVEIIEEEKKIPEKLDVLVEVMSSDKVGVLTNEIGEIQRRFNQLIDYLKSKGE